MPLIVQTLTGVLPLCSTTSRCSKDRPPAPVLPHHAWQHVSTRLRVRSQQCSRASPSGGTAGKRMSGKQMRWQMPTLLVGGLSGEGSVCMGEGEDSSFKHLHLGFIIEQKLVASEARQ
eukprot:1161517-Pelagomonas_calceolata.AAC.7